MTRLESIKRYFKEIYPLEKECSVFYAPGRVNLIGGHTDYNGLPVLPLAINRSMLLALSPRNDNKIIVKSEDGYEPVNFEISDNIKKSKAGSWANYIKAAAQYLQRKEKKLYGFNGVVSGNIPPAAGLSSSSALVVVTGFALSEINNLIMDRLMLARDLALAEMYVGTEGGGMDQAVCMLNKKGHALKIDFNPLRVKNIELPDSHCIVVCNSLIKAEKSGSARITYNLRAAECRIGIEMINAFLRKIVMPEIKLLGDIPERMEELGFDNYNRLLDTVFTKDVYSAEEIADYCNREVHEFIRNAAEFENQSFAIKKRCRHVLSEGRRVNKGADYLVNGKVTYFCRLMNESHLSCRDDYEISCEEVDELVRICNEYGADGARITGAGFGGSVVCMVSKDKTDKFKELVGEKYYKDYLQNVHPEIDNSGDNIIICSAVCGAEILL